MLYFPQLATGAFAQFPLERRFVRRTVVNRLPGGAHVKLDDPSAMGIVWALQYKGLTEAERRSIETLFLDAEGRLRSFTFIDPCGNMLRWSEDLSKPVWHVDGGLQIATEVLDPTGSNRAVRITNTGQTVQRFEQKVDAPGWFEYCFSFEARATVPTRLTLSTSNDGGTILSEHLVGQAWTLCSCSGRIESTDEELTCAVAVDSGTSVETFGFQLQAQPNAGSYSQTKIRSGVHQASRFMDDELQFQANGFDDHSIDIRVFSRGQGQS